MALYEDIVAELTTELTIVDSNFNVDLLEIQVENAIKSVKRARKYPDYYTETQINNDLQKYYDVISNVAKIYYSKVGAYGEMSHNEDGIVRSYEDSNKLLNGVLPICRI